VRSEWQDFLLNEDRTGGFSTMADGRHDITLLKRGKSVAWFSAMLDDKVVKAFIELVKTCEEMCESQTNGS